MSLITFITVTTFTAPVGFVALITHNTHLSNHIRKVTAAFAFRNIPSH